jgi:hypothetical protein
MSVTTTVGLESIASSEYKGAKSIDKSRLTVSHSVVRRVTSAAMCRRSGKMAQL